MKRLRLFDNEDSLDSLRLTFYLNTIIWVISLVFGTPMVVCGLIALFSAVLIFIRDDIVRIKRKPIDELNEKFALMQSDLTALKFNNLR